MRVLHSAPTAYRFWQHSDPPNPRAIPPEMPHKHVKRWTKFSLMKHPEALQNCAVQFVGTQGHRGMGRCVTRIGMTGSGWTVQA